MSEIFLFVIVVCCASTWHRRTWAANNVVPASAMSVAFLADGPPEEFFNRDGNGPIAVIIVLLMAVVLNAVGVWRVVKRRRENPRQPG